jgi:hypothetical protein
MRLTAPLAAILLTVSGPISADSREVAPDCDCTHLEALQAELRNAIRLQTAFRNKIAELRGMNTPTSLTEFKRFTENEARNGLEKVPGGTGPSEVDYESWGKQNIVVAQGNSTSKLCGRTQTAEQELALAEQRSACSGIGKALRAHEDYHMNMCGRIGFFAYIAMHGADRAQEEAEAYGVQIAVLRREIAGVLERSKLRVELEQDTRVQMPPNPVYTAINLKNNGKLRTTPPTISGDNIHFDGTGEQSMNGTIEGNCHYTGLPITLPAIGSVDTDGLTARVQFRVEGTVPTFGMACNMGGAGFSMPVPVGSNAGLPAPVPLPLKNKAEVTHNMANTMAANAMAGSGMSMSGKTKVRLVLDCPARP